MTEKHPLYRVGVGFDAHRFSEGPKLILGGVEIPNPMGLVGHSDGDVLTHAICDALLGALGSGDIGTRFPDDDPQYRGISSLILLEKTMNLLDSENYAVENADTVIVCEKPRLSSFIPQIKKKLASVLCIKESSLGVKATTTDGMGAVGRGEGIAAYASVLIKNS